MTAKEILQLPSNLAIKVYTGKQVQYLDEIIFGNPPKNPDWIHKYLWNGAFPYGDNQCMNLRGCQCSEQWYRENQYEIMDASEVLRLLAKIDDPINNSYDLY